MKDVAQKPDDFRVVYQWREGSLPPPGHYEYTLSLGPGRQGKIIYLPNYPMYHPPIWKEKFDIDPPDLDRLYQLMMDKGFFRTHWGKTEEDTTGGELEWVEIRAEGKDFTVPDGVQAKEGVEEVYKLIRSLVPQKIWKALMKRRGEFIKAYPRE